MLLKKMMVVFFILFSFSMLACGNNQVLKQIKYYDMNQSLIQTIDNDESADLSTIEYPELEDIEGYQLITWSILEDELEVGKDYDIYPVYARTLNHTNDYGYTPKVVTNEDFILVFLLDSFNNDNIKSIQIYQKDNPDYYREINPTNRKWVSAKPVFEIYYNKIYLPALVGHEETLKMDIYDLDNQDFYQEMDIVQGDQRSFNEQIFLVLDQMILIETSEWTLESDRQDNFVDVYDLENYQFKENILEFEGVKTTHPYYIHFNGGLFAYNDKILMGKHDYLMYDNQALIYDINDFSQVETNERPLDIEEGYLPMNAFVEEDYIVSQYWILSISVQDKSFFEFKQIDGEEEPIQLEFNETVKFLEIRHEKVFILGYRANRLYIFDLETQVLNTVEYINDTQYYDYSGSMMIDNDLIITYQRDDDYLDNDIKYNYYSVINEDIHEYQFEALIDGHQAKFLSSTIVHNDKIYAIASYESSLYLIIYLPGETSPNQTIQIENARVNAFKSFEKVNDQLVIYLRDKSFIIG
ncbi:MAG: hypothetical protein ACLFPM_05515 [Candidatus Izemoplasmatales bacterium]